MWWFWPTLLMCRLLLVAKLCVASTEDVIHTSATYLPSGSLPRCAAKLTSAPKMVACSLGLKQCMRALTSCML